MSWTAVSGATSYKIQWKTSDQQWDSTNRELPSTTTSATIPGLANGTQYTVRVAATTSGGDGAWSDTATGTPSASFLDKVTGLQAATGNAALALSWVAVTGAASYKIQWKKDAEGWSSTRQTTSTTTSATLSSLSNGHQYTVRVRASNAGGDGAWSDTATGTPTTARLTVDAELECTSGHASTSTRGGQLEAWASSGPPSKSVCKENAFGPTVTINFAPGYTPPDDRIYTVTAYRDTKCKTPFPGVPPVVVSFSDLTASNVAAKSATLRLTSPPSTWSYKYTWPSGGTCSSAVSTASTNVTGLRPATTYTFKAYRGAGCSTEMATAPSFTTTPDKVEGVQVAPRNASLHVSWTAETGATGYKVQWKKSDQSWDSANRQTTSTTSSATISGLDNDTQYTVRVLATNTTGDGAWSDTATGTPLALTLTAGTATATGMTLTIANWSDDWYWKYTTPTGGDCSSSKVAAGTKTATVGSLDSNTAYTFKAYSDSSCETELAAASPVATLPPKPVKPTATAGTGSGELTLTSSVTGTATLTKWQYVKKEGTNAWETDWTDIDSTSSSLSHTLTGLTNNTSYLFKVRARNASGAGAESDVSDAATPRAASLTAGTATASGMTLTIANWSAAWYYEYSTPTGGDCSSEVAAGTKTATVGSLDSNTAYTFKAYSDNACETELAAASSYATLPPQPAKPVLTVSLGDGKVRLASSVTGTATLTKWQYKKSKDGGSYDADWTDISNTSSSLSHTVSGLTDGSAYKFKVRAENGSGFGAESDESDAATPRAVTLTAGTATATGMTLTVANWSGAWHYKYTAPDGGSCSTEAVPAGTSSKAVTGLDSNTAHTFKAYSDNGCETELAAASARATLPPKPAKPTATAGGGSGELVLKSSVTGTATLTKWQYKKKKDNGNYDDDWTDISQHLEAPVAHGERADRRLGSTKFKVRARNASGFGAESDESDAATPRATSLTAGSATATGMTLTIAGHNAAWYWKRTAPSAGDCSTEVAAGTKTATVGSLDSNTAYTFKAYSDNGCATELAAASPVATLPPKPAKPTATDGGGSGKVTLTSSVTGTATLTKWQYIKKEGEDGGARPTGATSPAPRRTCRTR